jgi:hypothetical protein
LLSLLKCRELLGVEGLRLTDSQVERVRDEMQALASAAVTRLETEGGVQRVCPHVVWGLVPADCRESLEERAAIFEYDGGVSRDVAERAAFAQLLRHAGDA